MSFLILDNLQLAFDEPVIKGFSLELQEGEIGCLLGPSGCGKTSILRLIAGFEAPASGRIHLRGKKLASARNSLPPEKRDIGVVFQDYALFPHLTVAGNIGFAMDTRRDRADREKDINELLKLIGMPDLHNRYPHELSGGQQQRVALARALAQQPSLMLLDEPFSNLDADLRRELSLEVRQILKQRNIAALLVTHDQQEAFAIADRVAVMHDGRCLQYDAPYVLYHEPRSRRVAEFIGEGEFIRGVVLPSGEVETALGVLRGDTPIEQAPGAAVDILIRPDDVQYSADGPHQATVRRRLFNGPYTLYRLDTAAGPLKALWPSHFDFREGQTIPFTLQTEHLVLFPQADA